ncbi:MAG: HD domain-containing protein [Elusimicrobia bacterium]|nr:HD domain-containing protein [Elusimicrobiota bacterium]
MNRRHPHFSDTPSERDQLRDWRRRTNRLFDYTKRMSQERDLQTLLSLVIEAACKILKAQRATVFLLDKTKNQVWAPVATGQPVIRLPADQGIVGRAIFGNRIVNVMNAYGDKDFSPSIDRTTGFRTKTILTIPLVRKRGDTVGALQALNKRGGVFDRADEDMGVLIAEQAAAAVSAALHHDELQSAYRDTIFRLAAAAEFKDQDTRNHLERVSRYCDLLARAIGQEESWCERLALASPMHDIGKLGVPDAILKKPGKLDDAEWVEMRRHPLHGASILADADNELLRMSERIALGHHEKWDGSGYPAGIRGDAIPLEARIVAVADVFDALTSRRCYKPAFSLNDALNILYEGSGKHFDSTLIDAFKRVLPRVLQVMESFADRPTEK